MAHVSRGFRGRRVDQRDASRLPRGQYLVEDFPVLSAGPTPYTPLEEWIFSITGDIAEPRTWTSRVALPLDLALPPPKWRTARKQSIAGHQEAGVPEPPCRLCVPSCKENLGWKNGRRERKHAIREFIGG
jgi:hypothetical protein